MKIRFVFLHGHGFLVQNAAVTGGPHQFYDREQHQFRFWTGDSVSFQNFQVEVIETAGFIRKFFLKSSLKDSPGQVFCDKFQKRVILLKFSDDVIGDLDHQCIREEILFRVESIVCLRE